MIFIVVYTRLLLLYIFLVQLRNVKKKTLNISPVSQICVLILPPSGRVTVFVANSTPIVGTLLLGRAPRTYLIMLENVMKILIVTYLEDVSFLQKHHRQERLTFVRKGVFG